MRTLTPPKVASPHARSRFALLASLLAAICLAPSRPVSADPGLQPAVAQGICTPFAEVCAPPTGCAPCQPATLIYQDIVEKRGAGPSFPDLTVPKFDRSLGTLRNVTVRTEVMPGYALAVGETTLGRACSFPPATSRYQAFVRQFRIMIGLTTVVVDLDSMLWTGTEMGCLDWGVQGGLAGNQLPAFDQCLDYGLPQHVLNPLTDLEGMSPANPLVINDCAMHPLFADIDDPTGMYAGNCSTSCSDHSARDPKRIRAGPILGSAAPDPEESGYADVRIFDQNDIYDCTKCFSDSDCLSQFVSDECCQGEVVFDVSTTSGVVNPTPDSCPGFDPRAEVTVGVRITVTYEYCPYPPDALDDCGDVCRVVGASTVIPVLANDIASTVTSSCPDPEACDDETLDCAALTNSNGISTPTYGTAVWVTNGCPPGPMGLCAPGQTYPCIRYTLTSLPPANCVYDEFTYTITNSSGCSDTATVRVLIGNPDAMDDLGYELCESPGEEVVIPVLCNDTVCGPQAGIPCPGRTLNCAVLTGSFGISGVAPYAEATWVTCAACVAGQPMLCAQNRCIRYRLIANPPDGQRVDDFTYTIRDSSGCEDTATVRVRIASPEANDDEAVVCAAVGQTVRINVLCNDASKRPLLCGELDGTMGLSDPAYGTVRWVTGANCGPNDLCTDPFRCIEYTVDTLPPGGLVDTFTYRIVDGLGCRRTATVRVTLCRLDAMDDVGATCGEDVARVCILANDTWSCGTLGCEAVTILGVDPPGAGSATLTASCPPGTTACGDPLAGCATCCLTFDPAPGFSGTAVVRYRLRAGNPDLPGTPCESEAVDCLDDAQVVICVKPSPIAMDDKVLVEPGSAFLCDVLVPNQYCVDVLANDSPGTDCETCCGAPCAYVGCPEIVVQGQHSFSEVLPDCRVRITVLPTFTTFDVIRYKIRNACGCCAEAVIQLNTCPTYNRQQPGSLVLYPEFDNRETELTLLTLTNTNCDFFDGAVRVAVIYIDRKDCFETDFSFNLSPCDTVSWMTSAQNPNAERGYVYVYATNVAGQPISYNHLIGHQFRVNGFDNVSYTVNPWVFRSPIAHREVTDTDGDGNRDLDGREYDPPPGELLIPRFLGQDPAPIPGHQSELVLVNLSGGAAFTTLVDFDVYNDNEEMLSAQYEFYCWDRVPLRTVSGAFDNGVLQGTNHDLDEILGASSRESGWFRLRGRIAVSPGFEEIDRPSILAHLIEIVGNRDVADLPYDECPPGNGDLLPKHPLGDGPPFSNADDQ